MDCPLLTVSGQGTGDFIDLLKKLGLSDAFLRTYPVPKLVEWGWLRPQHRIVFPTAYFSGGSMESHVLQVRAATQEPLYGELWDSEYFCEGESDPMWFLHPFFTPKSKAGQLLQSNSIAVGLPPLPTEIEQDNGNRVAPYVDYYFAWQAYALLDVIRAADRFGHFVMDTPDVKIQVESLVRSTDMPTWNPHRYLDDSENWGGYAEVMT